MLPLVVGNGAMFRLLKKMWFKIETPERGSTRKRESGSCFCPEERTLKCRSAGSSTPGKPPYLAMHPKVLNTNALTWQRSLPAVIFRSGQRAPRTHRCTGPEGSARRWSGRNLTWTTPQCLLQVGAKCALDLFCSSRKTGLGIPFPFSCHCSCWSCLLAPQRSCALQHGAVACLNWPPPLHPLFASLFGAAAHACEAIAGGGGCALQITKRLKDAGSWVWQLQRTDVRR